MIDAIAIGLSSRESKAEIDHLLTSQPARHKGAMSPYEPPNLPKSFPAGISTIKTSRRHIIVK